MGYWLHDKKWYFDHNWGGGGEIGHQKYHFFYAAPKETMKQNHGVEFLQLTYA